MLTVGSVFAGQGGFDLGFERAGAKVIWSCEIDANCRKVLRKHWPGVPRFKDVRTVTGAGLRAAGLVPDVLVGGFPCQDLSVAGARAGLDGERSGLFFEFARIAEEARPEWLVIENVPGLLSAGCKPPCVGGCVATHGGAMGAVIGTLADIGYMGAARVLDAQYAGVAQRRRRVFFVCHARDGRRAAEVLLEPEGGGGDPPARRAAGEGPAGGAENGAEGDGIPPVALGGGSGNRGWCDDLDRATFVPAVSNALCSNRGQRNDHNEQTFIPTAFRKATKAHHADDWERWEAAAAADTLAANGMTSSATAVVQPVAFSIYPESGQGAVRRLLPVECLRLQAFPDWWLDDLGLADSTKYRMVGNALCTSVAYWIARRLTAVHDGRNPGKEVIDLEGYVASLNGTKEAS